MPLFAQLWKNYPDQSKLEAKCFNKQADSEQAFGNYCAIMMSECFHRSGVQIGGLSANRCWSHTGLKHVLLAEQLAQGLKTMKPNQFNNMIKVTPSLFQTELKDKTGVVFFKDYWQRGNETFETRTGDHIDLWNKSRLTSRPMWVRQILEWYGAMSDLQQSREIWFWEVT